MQQDTWPRGVRVLSFDELDHLGLDSENRIDWRGKRVRTSARLTFSQALVAVIVTTAAAVQIVKDRIEIAHALR